MASSSSSSLITITITIPLLLLLVSMSPPSLASQDCDSRCRTENCGSDGVCICDLPSNSTMLLGDRSFFGGKFCDIPRTMCDGSNSFWCQNGTCNEIVQGETYTCLCEEGYAGENCELEGIPCGDSYCFHNAECIQAEDPCDCPADWKGSQDCSMPTVKNSVSSKLPTTSFNTHKHKDHDEWYLPVAVVVVVVAIGILIGVRSMRKRAAATKFYKLQQVQMQGFDEDEEALAHGPLKKAEIA